MEVGLFPNPRRPGIGLKPRREGQRPLLPQHARHCPVLEAGSSLGFMVYPSLGEKELFQISFEGEGRYQLDYSVNPNGNKWEPVFSVTFILPVGTIGATKEKVTMHVDATPESTSIASMMARMFIAVDDLGTPSGAVTLRGAWNFQTPTGWDTVYMPILNNIERPVAPMLVIRVETDWYVHDTEFRYVLQPGESISASHNLPIGQVMFVPREPITLREGSAEEAAQRLDTSGAFFEQKANAKIKTSYGLEYSPHYQRISRARNAGAAHSESSSTADSSATADQPTADQPTADQPTADQPTADSSAADSRSANAPATNSAPTVGSARSDTPPPTRPPASAAASAPAANSAPGSVSAPTSAPARPTAPTAAATPAPGSAPTSAPTRPPASAVASAPAANSAPGSVSAPTSAPARPTAPTAAAKSPASTPPSTDPNKPGRNDPCPCGSGKKFKKCHGANS